VYHALLDPEAITIWRVPTGMTCQIHEFDAREGGGFRISLTYDSISGRGKTTARTDMYHGRFAKLVPNERVVELVEFDTADPGLRGEMTITTTLADGEDGHTTELTAIHDGLPATLSPEENEMGWRSSLAKLATLVETNWAAVQAKTEGRHR
jgi:uncharacterized protein YndB with AHSA1/START domain